MKKVLTVLFLFGLVLNVYADYVQVIFNKKLWKNAEITSIIKSKNNDCVIALSPLTNEEKAVVSVLKIDQNANILWTKNFSSYYPAEIADIINTKDGGYIAVGQISNINNGQIEEYGFIVKLDKNGNVIWSKKLSTYNKLTSIVQTKNGDYLTIGKNKNNDYIFTITKLDKFGNELWSKIFTKKIDFIINSNDDNYIVTGEVYFNKKNYGWIAKLNKDGNIIWKRIFGNKYSESKIKSITKTNDENYCFVGKILYKDKDYGWIVKFNNDGKIIWEKKFIGKDELNSKNSLWFQSILQLKDGKYVIGSFDGHFIMLNKNGEIVMSKTSTDLMDIKKIIPFSNNEFLLFSYPNDLIKIKLTTLEQLKNICKKEPKKCAEVGNYYYDILKNLSFSKNQYLKIENKMLNYYEIACKNGNIKICENLIDIYKHPKMNNLIYFVNKDKSKYIKNIYRKLLSDDCLKNKNDISCFKLGADYYLEVVFNSKKESKKEIMKNIDLAYKYFKEANRLNPKNKKYLDGLKELEKMKQYLKN